MLMNILTNPNPSNNKSVLIIAYYFPPSGGPGVQRVLKYTKYLREFGWEAVVLTVENANYPAFDYSLLSELPEDIKVFRTKIFEPYEFYRAFTGKKNEPIDVNVIKKEDQKLSFKEKVAEFIRATFFIPDARIGWYPYAKKKAKEIINTHKIEAIYSSSPPYTCSIIARYIKRKFKLPWIAGFRDPWTGFISAPKRWLIPRWIDQRLEFSVFDEADLVEVAWEGIAKDAFSKYPNLDSQKFIHIPNGFDPEDFPQIEYSPNQKFTLTYTGSMYGRRNPKSLFEAIELLISREEINPNSFLIKLIGRFGGEIYEMIEQTSFKNSIKVVGYLEHSESLKELVTSDALLLIVDESKESEEIVPGKVFEYLGSRRPILAICPTNGAVAKLIMKTKSGLVAHQTQIEQIAENFKKLFEMWKNKENFEPNVEKIFEYNRKNHAQKLASLLDLITQNK